MPSEIIAAADHLKEISKRFEGLKYDIGALKPWFSKTEKVLFDCDKGEDRQICLKRIMGRQDFDEFVIVSVVREIDTSGKPVYSLEESRFKRIGQERIEGFINRYTKNLREPVALSMQLFNKQQVELVGFTYVSPEERAELLGELSGRGRKRE